MNQPNIVDVYEARESVETGQALLVCAYDEVAKFQAARLSGAISFSDFSERLPSLSTAQPIILYCA